jgi:hypothetical protein
MRYVLLGIGVLFSIAAHAGDYFHVVGAGDVERYYEATPAGLHAYVADLKAMDPKAARLLEPALHWIEEKQASAVRGASIQAFFGATLLFSSFTALRDSRDRGMNTPAAVLGVGFMAAALIVYDLLSPSRADLLDFVNTHNAYLPAQPLHYRLDNSVPYAPAAQSAGVTIPF